MQHGAAPVVNEIPEPAQVCTDRSARRGPNRVGHQIKGAGDCEDLG